MGERYSSLAHASPSRNILQRPELHAHIVSLHRGDYIPSIGITQIYQMKLYGISYKIYKLVDSI
jgi:hypothetical protein